MCLIAKLYRMVSKKSHLSNVTIELSVVFVIVIMKLIIKIIFINMLF
jgi:hypothetical protein